MTTFDNRNGNGPALASTSDNSDSSKNGDDSEKKPAPPDLSGDRVAYQQENKKETDFLLPVSDTEVKKLMGTLDKTDSPQQEKLDPPEGSVPGDKPNR